MNTLFEKVQAYKTADGVIHHSVNKAVEHMLFLVFEKQLELSELSRSVSTRDLAEHFANNAKLRASVMELLEAMK